MRKFIVYRFLFLVVYGRYIIHIVALLIFYSIFTGIEYDPYPISQVGLIFAYERAIFVSPVLLGTCPSAKPMKLRSIPLPGPGRRAAKVNDSGRICTLLKPVNGYCS
jgi:hypothetical protein